jgi:hypothetical protein
MKDAGTVEEKMISWQLKGGKTPQSSMQILLPHMGDKGPCII